MLFLWIAVVCLIAYCYIRDHIQKGRIYALKNVIPSPTALPLLGHSLLFLSDSAGIFNTLTSLFHKYDRFFSLKNNGKFYVFLKDAEDIEVLLADNVNITKADLYKVVIPWIGNGLLTSTGSKWKKHRRIITPTFFFKILDDYLKIFNKNDDVFIEHIAEEIGKGPFNIYPYVNRLAFDNICETAIGMDFHVQKSRDSTYLKAIKDICATASIRLYQVWYMMDIIFNFTKLGVLQKKAIQIVHNKTLEIIKDKRQLLSDPTKIKKAEDVNDFGTKRKMAFLDQLLESAGSQLSDEEIKDEINTFMFEGHDTVSSLLSFTLYMLAQHQDVQDKVYYEQMRVMGDVNSHVETKDLNAMLYLDQVVKEAVRLFPVVAMFGRELDADLQLPNGPLLPAGTNVVLFVYQIHRNPKVWDNPDEFNPENFSPDAPQKHPFAYIPFSAGSRNCIGQKFAKVEIKSTISRLIRKYKLLPSPNPEHKLRLASELVLNSKSGHNVCLEHRNQ